MNKTEQHKKGIIEALEKSLGVVTTACKSLGIGRTTFYEWMKDDEEFSYKVNDIQNIALDFAEQEITGADGMPNNFKIEIVDRIEDAKD